ncbi:hypothetical protein [Caminibacter sp.]
MKKIFLVSTVAAALFAGEFDYGNGKFHIKGGFYGLESSKSTDIQTFTIKQQHKNILSTNWFYKYNITWLKSNTLNTTVATINSYLSSTGYSINYKLYGIDANFILGRDVLKQKDTFLGAGLLLGVSFPYIKSKSSNSSNNTTLETKTEIKTYKIGLNINAKKEFNRYFAVYLSGNYAKQIGKVKNKELDSSFNVSGNYKSFDLNIRFTPFSYKKKIGFITISPKLYFTLGYRYDYWQVNDIKIDVTGNDLGYKSDLKMYTNVGYFGIGYSF